MLNGRRIGGICGGTIVLLIVVLFFPVVATGALVKIEIQVTSGALSATEYISTDYDWSAVTSNPGAPQDWYLSAPVVIQSGGQTLGTIIHLSLNITGADLNPAASGTMQHPVIEFGYEVQAGTYGAMTTFSIKSEVLDVGDLIGAQGKAYADTGVAFPFKNLWGNFGTKTYQSLYDGSVPFADLVEADPIPGLSTVEETAEWQAVPGGSVSSMQAAWAFDLDSVAIASGASRYEVTGEATPEPASILLLGAGCMALIRKRRI